MARRTDGRQASRSAGRGASGSLLRSLHLFAEVAITGVLIAIGSLPVVTSVPALAAGVAHLRRDVSGRPTSVRRFAAEWWAATRDLWPLGLGLAALAVLLVGDWQLATSGVLPGGQIVALVVALCAAAACAVVLRAAGAWSDDDGEPATERQARAVLAVASERASADVSGSVLLVSAVVMAAVLVWMLVPLALVVGGLLALAVVGVEVRRRTV
ncbi:Poxvirus protein I5 [Isoptericola aurantiacus]|uniref:Poxvirus protein I5 n=1 Tax=Isoptericola aurantiacus TaxID=3377839 RepID=UPI00383BABE7